MSSNLGEHMERFPIVDPKDAMDQISYLIYEYNYFIGEANRK